jgi:hypothetical protein
MQPGVASSPARPGSSPASAPRRWGCWCCRRLHRGARQMCRVGPRCDRSANARRVPEFGRGDPHRQGSAGFFGRGGVEQHPGPPGHGELPPQGQLVGLAGAAASQKDSSQSHQQQRWLESERHGAITAGVATLVLGVNETRVRSVQWSQMAGSLPTERVAEGQRGLGVAGSHPRNRPTLKCLTGQALWARPESPLPAMGQPAQS